MVKLPWTYFTEDTRHIEVMGLLTAWMKHDRGSGTINYPEAFFFPLKATVVVVGDGFIAVSECQRGHRGEHMSAC